MIHLLLSSILATATHQKVAPWVSQNLAPGVSLTTPVKLVSSRETPTDPRVARIEDWGAKVGNHSFIASISTLNKMTVPEMSAMLSATAVQAVARPGNNLLAANDLLLNGWPGIALKARESTQLNVSSFSYRYGRMLITIAAFAPASEGQPKDIEKFLHSLHLGVKGDQNFMGPRMFRFPLGNSMISATFPSKPIVKESTADSTTGFGPLHSFISDYGMRSFMVTYRDLAPKKKVTNELISSEVLKGFQATLTKQQKVMVGTDSGLQSSFSIAGQTIGTFVVFQHGKRVITVLGVEPKVYGDQTLVNPFIKSVRFGK